MPLLAEYINVSFMQLITAIVAGSATTWVLMHSDPQITPKWHPSIWTTLQFTVFVAWSTAIITLVQLFAYFSGIWAHVVTYVHGKQWMIGVIVYLLIYTIFWLGASLSFQFSVPGDCTKVQHCTQITATRVFSWWTFASFVINDVIFLWLYRQRRLDMGVEDWTGSVWLRSMTSRCSCCCYDEEGRAPQNARPPNVYRRDNAVVPEAKPSRQSSQYSKSPVSPRGSDYLNVRRPQSPRSPRGSEHLHLPYQQNLGLPQYIPTPQSPRSPRGSDHLNLRRPQSPASDYYIQTPQSPRSPRRSEHLHLPYQHNSDPPQYARTPQSPPNVVATPIELRCVQCSRDPCQQNSAFCGPACLGRARVGAPKLIALPNTHYMFDSVVELFGQSWLHDTPKPTVRYVYVVVSTEASDQKYWAHRDLLEQQNHFKLEGLNAGNEMNRWHGTTRTCNVGDPGHSSLCASSFCSLCGIIRSSFDIEKYGFNWARFGKGIYTSATSSKSHDYQKNSAFSQFNALLLNNVLVGRGYEIFENNENLAGPPPGYHSVLGQPGISLNFDETVVYRNEAIRPAYLVLYSNT